MKLKALAAAFVVVAVPLAIQSAEGQTQKQPKEKRYCEVNQQIGTRLGGVRTCRTKAERDAAKAEGKATVDRIQSQKNMTEFMAGAGARGMCRGLPRGC